MQNLYKQKDAESFVKTHPFLPEALALRIYTSRLIGANNNLVLHGGGNTSVKLTSETFVSLNLTTESLAKETGVECLMLCATLNGKSKDSYVAEKQLNDVNKSKKRYFILKFLWIR